MLKISQRPRIMLMASCLVLSLFSISLILVVKTNSQSRRIGNEDNKADLIAKVDNSVSVPLRVIENDNAPLRITEAKAKEISSGDFTSLTGETAKILNVSSVPEVVVHNTSDKTISQFMLVIRDPKSRNTRTLDFAKISISPDKTFLIKPGHFVSPEKITSVDKDGLTVTVEKPKMDSVNYWIQFAERTNFFITIGIVQFEDGSRWVLKEEGEIQ